MPTSGDDQLLRRRIGALAALAAVLVGSAGCGGSDDQEQGNLTRGEKQAQAVAEEVLAAVRVGDRRTVCALLTHRIRRVEAGSGGAGLVGRCARKIDRRAEHLPARDAQIESVEERFDPDYPTVYIDLSDGKRMVIVDEAGGWELGGFVDRVSGTPPGPYGP